MKTKLYYKRVRKFALWILLAAIIYCWNKPQTYIVIAVMYGIFLILNGYYCYLEAKEEEKERLGTDFQNNKFYEQYMEQKRSLIRMEIMIIVMLMFVICFYINK